MRDYKKGNKIELTYKLNHEQMTMKKVIELRKKWLTFDKGEFTIKEIINKLDDLVDESDPDTNKSNNIHDFQTAESLRQMYPDEDWLHLIGLLHDLGKIMICWGEPQHFVVGDTYVMGCKFSKKIVYYDFFRENMDYYKYKTELGLYYKNCGLKNIIMSWGHDEYMYEVLKNHKSCLIPQKGLDVIRYHSFYSWHSEGEYKNLTSIIDEKETLPLIQKFNEHDLYSKTNNVPDCEKLWNEYYENLCKKYGLSGKIKW